MTSMVLIMTSMVLSMPSMVLLLWHLWYYYDFYGTFPRMHFLWLPFV